MSKSKSRNDFIPLEDRATNLGSILDLSFEWLKTTEGEDYWGEKYGMWEKITDDKLLEYFHTLLIPYYKDGWEGYTRSWDILKESIVIEKLKKLAKYQDRFGQDPSVTLMLELIADK